MRVDIVNYTRVASSSEVVCDPVVSSFKMDRLIWISGFELFGCAWAVGRVSGSIDPRPPSLGRRGGGVHAHIGGGGRGG